MPSPTIYSIHHSKHPLTTYLRHRWQEQRTKNQCHTRQPHIKENTWLEHNIFHLVNPPLPLDVLPLPQTSTLTVDPQLPDKPSPSPRPLLTLQEVLLHQENTCFTYLAFWCFLFYKKILFTFPKPFLRVKGISFFLFLNLLLKKPKKV